MDDYERGRQAGLREARLKVRFEIARGETSCLRRRGDPYEDGVFEGCKAAMSFIAALLAPAPSDATEPAQAPSPEERP